MTKTDRHTSRLCRKLQSRPSSHASSFPKSDFRRNLRRLLMVLVVLVVLGVLGVLVVLVPVLVLPRWRRRHCWRWCCRKLQGLLRRQRPAHRAQSTTARSGFLACGDAATT